jgi:hypothetical protein
VALVLICASACTPAKHSFGFGGGGTSVATGSGSAGTTSATDTLGTGGATGGASSTTASGGSTTGSGGAATGSGGSTTGSGGAPLDGGPPVGACGNDGDIQQIEHHPMLTDVDQCSVDHFSDPAAIGACVMAADGTSGACSDCYAGLAQCTLQSCLSQCLVSPGSSACVSCALTSCGGAWNACSGLRACAADADCGAVPCVNGACADHCADGQRNADESDADCGGTVCGRCPSFKACTVNEDCQSQNCFSGICL